MHVSKTLPNKLNEIFVSGNVGYECQINSVICEYEKKPEFSMSRHQSSKVVKLLKELTKVNRVSRSLESKSFVFLERSHATVPKFAIHRSWNIRDVSQKYLRKSECNRQLLQIWDNERHYRSSVRETLPPAREGLQ